MRFARTHSHPYKQRVARFQLAAQVERGAGHAAHALGGGSPTHARMHRAGWELAACELPTCERQPSPHRAIFSHCGAMVPRPPTNGVGEAGLCVAPVASFILRAATVDPYICGTAAIW